MGTREKTLVRFSHILRSSIFILGHLYKEKLIFPGREDTIYYYYDNIHAGEYIECCTEIPKIAVKHEHNAISGWYLNMVWKHRAHGIASAMRENIIPASMCMGD